MNINDIMAAPTGVKRPDHPDFWRLSEIILALKAEMAENEGNIEEQERLWRKHYNDIGDFDSIAYAAIQCGLELHNIKTGSDWMVLRVSGRQESYIKSVQAYFDGFVMGAEFERRGGHQEAP